MNNEPVGYFRKNYDGEWVEAEAGYENESIPLYTNPVKDESWINKEKLKQSLEWDAKQRQPMQILEDGRIVPVFTELTDEEIMEVAYNLKNSYEPYNINFARAILKKASEK